MTPLLHSVNIGTLAAWLSVTGFGTVGVLVPEVEPPHGPPQLAEIEVLADGDFLLGHPEQSGSDAGVADLPSEQAPAEPAESLPAPPEAPMPTEMPPLPEIPALPAVSTSPAPETPTRSAARTASRNVAANQTPARANRTGSSSGGKTGSASTGERSGGSGMSDASRLAAGRMPAPNYPPEARRLGQSGTVVVEFTVDSSGRVIAAHAKSESPWPLLNHEAVRTVRRWKFPPGGVMKLQRPIVFQLR
jgi:protein TonB